MRSVLTGLAATSLLSIALSAGPGDGALDVGSISGHVKLTSRVRGVPLRSNAYQSRGVHRHDAGSRPEIRNVVVFLKDAAYRGALTAGHGVIEQQDEAFTPRVLAVTRGSTVDFPNSDPYFHNVFSLSSAAEFNLGRYPQGKSKSRTFTRAGLVKVYCQIHSHMSATIMVLDHPYFTTPDLDGSFTLPQVPEGRYTIVGWHERVGEQTSTIQVEAGGTASVELSLPLGDAP
jgi:plastocyanin